MIFETTPQEPSVEYLRTLNEIHDLAMSRLIGGDILSPMELAELCEDVGNLYLNLSDRIRAMTLKSLPTGLRRE